MLSSEGHPKRQVSTLLPAPTPPPIADPHTRQPVGSDQQTSPQEGVASMILLEDLGSDIIVENVVDTSTSLLTLPQPLISTPTLSSTHTSQPHTPIRLPITHDRPSEQSKGHQEGKGQTLYFALTQASCILLMSSL